MDWKRVTIPAPEEALELVGECLAEAGVTQYEIVEDAPSVQRILEETAPYWDYVDANEVLAAREPCVRAYLTCNAAGERQLEAIRARLDLLKAQAQELNVGELALRVEVVREEDWANNWKQYYRPTPVGERLLILPSWEKMDKDTGRVVLKMDPGMVFGTGTHETTQLCLAALEKRITPGMRVLDLGCGSGILSIAALLLGAKEALGVDIDPNAVDIAYRNAEENGVGRDRYRVVSGNILDDHGFVDSLGGYYDCIVANIVANVIIPLSALIPRLLAPQGQFIASGIIEDRFAEVKAAMEAAGLKIVEKSSRRDWMQVTAQLAGKDSIT